MKQKPTNSSLLTLTSRTMIISSELKLIKLTGVMAECFVRQARRSSENDKTLSNSSEKVAEQ